MQFYIVLRHAVVFGLRHVIALSLNLNLNLHELKHCGGAKHVIALSIIHTYMN
jgi:hypothetical protein